LELHHSPEQVFHFGGFTNWRLSMAFIRIGAPYGQSQAYGRARPRLNGRIIIALVIAAVSLLSYYGMRSKNPITGETQHISLSVDQEVAMGLQAAPEMAAQFGGLLQDPKAQDLVDQVGQRIVRKSAAGGGTYPFEFHVLADDKTVNAFALPGGPIFITAALLAKLETEGQLAGVLSHEVGHVVARHAAEHLAKAQLTQGLTGAAVIATYDPNRPSSQQAAVMAAVVGQMITLKYGREDELESDRLGVRFMTEAGYDPRSMIRVMEILEEASKGRGTGPDFLATHPNPGRRIEKIEGVIHETWPGGVPNGLAK
jgi:beta-barrel assembly-enhancing protease